MCLDHPEKVIRAAILDIIPQHHLFNHMTKRMGAVLLALVLQHPARRCPSDDGRRSGLVHREEARENQTGLSFFDKDALAEYKRCFRNPETIHADLRGLPRRLRRSISKWTQRISRPGARSNVRCCCYGARPAASGATTIPARPKSGRATRRISWRKGDAFRALSVRGGAGGDDGGAARILRRLGDNS